MDATPSVRATKPPAQKGDTRDAVTAATGYQVHTPVQTRGGAGVYPAATIDGRAAVVNKQRAVDGAAQRRERFDAALHVTSAARAASLAALMRATAGNDLASQSARVLAALRLGPITTFEIRKFLDVSEPGARIWTLRHRDGHNIMTMMVKQESRHGRSHCIAQYVLIRGGE